MNLFQENSVTNVLMDLQPDKKMHKYTEKYEFIGPTQTDVQ